MESYILVIVYIILSFGSYTITETKDEKKKKTKRKDTYVPSTKVLSYRPGDKDRSMKRTKIIGKKMSLLILHFNCLRNAVFSFK